MSKTFTKIDINGWLDLAIKFIYIIPALSLVLSTLKLLTYWTVLGVPILEYLSIGYLLTMSIDVFVVIASAPLISIPIIIFLSKARHKFMRPILLGVLIVCIGGAGYVIFKFSDSIVRDLIVLILILVLQNGFLIWLYNYYDKIRLYSKSTESKYEIKPSETSSHSWVRTRYYIVCYLLLLLVTPIFVGYYSALKVNEMKSFRYIESKNLQRPDLVNSDKLVYLGKINDNYFFKEDSSKSFIIKQISDFQHMEFHNYNVTKE